MKTQGLPLHMFLREQTLRPEDTEALHGLLEGIAFAGVQISEAIGLAALSKNLGSAGICNIQGEEVQHLDKLAHDWLVSCLENCSHCVAVCSEEEAQPILFGQRRSDSGNYLVSIDPLDGSSNIDSGNPAGTVFSIRRRKSRRRLRCNEEDFCRPGKEQVAAGYILYSAATVLVWATRFGVHGFTLNPRTREFCLSHPCLQCPDAGPVYSVNESNFESFPESVKHYLDCLKSGQETSMSARYTGSMVADLHRILLKGGIFLYPSLPRQPQGKLRLLYECHPLAWIFEKAGGKAINGRMDILDIVPNYLHQRSPVYIGSRTMVEQLRALFLLDHES